MWIVYAIIIIVGAIILGRIKSKRMEENRDTASEKNYKRQVWDAETKQYTSATYAGNLKDYEGNSGIEKMRNLAAANLGVPAEYVIATPIGDSPDGKFTNYDVRVFSPNDPTILALQRQFAQSQGVPFDWVKVFPKSITPDGTVSYDILVQEN